MRVGILTYHFVYNEGAVWQTGCLLNAIRKMAPELKVEVINYVEPGLMVAMGVFSGGHKESFFDMQSSLVASELVSEDRLKEFEVVIVGSDVVWQLYSIPGILGALVCEWLGKPRIDSGATVLDRLRYIKQIWLGAREKRIVSPSWKKLPNPYWLPWSNRQTKISYAASIGYTQTRDLDKNTCALARRYLSDFDLISVRDENSKQFVESLLDVKVHKSADPTWLCEDAPESVKELLIESGWDGKSPLAGVLYPRGFRAAIDFDVWVTKYLKDRGYAVVSIIDANPHADVRLADNHISPMLWWSVIASLDFLFTVRTHPNIAALKYHTPFVNVDITAMIGGSSTSKSEDMLRDFGLGHLCLYKRKHISREKIRTLIDLAISRDWDWAHVDDVIARHRRGAVDYLKTVLELVATQESIVN